MRSFFALLSIALFGGCAATPITQQSIEGTYELRRAREGRWFAGESIELREGRFVYSIFTDVVDDPRLRRFPMRGGYTLDGSAIALHHPAVPSPSMIITRRFGRFLLWTPQQSEQYLRTGRTPEGVLYQCP